MLAQLQRRDPLLLTTDKRSINVYGISPSDWASDTLRTMWMRRYLKSYSAAESQRARYSAGYSANEVTDGSLWADIAIRSDRIHY